MRESEISGCVGNTKFLLDWGENFEILEFIVILERAEILLLLTRINNLLKLSLSTISKDRRSRTIIRAIPSIISFGVSFCTCDKFYIDSVSFLVHVLMFGSMCFKWRKPLVLNSW